MSAPRNITLIKTGEEFETNEFIDGKRVYGKRINCGNMPNNSTVNVDTGLTEECSVVRYKAFARHNTQKSVAEINGILGQAMYVGNTNRIALTTTSDRSAWTAYVDLYYTKN